MAFLNTITTIIGQAVALAPNIVAPNKPWHWLILKAFAFVADYGWRIVLFTVLLKLLLSPLDFYQRYKMNKNQKITERLKPTMEKMQKQYGDDKQAFSQKQMELNRKEGYSYFSSCLPMIVTMVVFITLWLSMQTVAQYMTFKEYITMYDEYSYATEQVDDAFGAGRGANENEILKRDVGQGAVYQMYYYGLGGEFKKNDKTYDSYDQYLRSADYITDLVADINAKKAEIAEKEEANRTSEKPDPNFALTAEELEYKNCDVSKYEGFTLGEDFDLNEYAKVQTSFLWIKNVWAPDVPWGDRAILDWSKFKSSIGKFGTGHGLTDEQSSAVVSEGMYNRVMGKLLGDKNTSRTNGYLILPVLVVLLSVGSQLLSTFQQKKAGQVNEKGGVATSMKVMMFFMPVMMGAFAIQYASIFTLYMVTNSLCTLFFNFTFTGIIKLMDNRKRTRNYGISTGSTRAYSSKNSPIIHYVKGANPNAGAKPIPPTPEEIKAAKKQNKAADEKKSEERSSRVVKQSARPDPHELMSMGQPAPKSKKKK